MRTVGPHKSSLGNLDANIMALIAYIISFIAGLIPGIGYFAWLAPLVLFFIEKESAFVRFHAMQAFLLQIASSIVSFVLTVVIGGLLGLAALGVATTGADAGALALFGGGGILGVIGMLFNLVVLVFTILAMVRAYRYEEYHIPLIGNLADNFMSRAR